jgi:1,4-alpha-glucan branching enzyme
MSKLSAEAYAIVEGRHADPFHYLGLHTEGDRTVVRAFLPEASIVEAIGEHGETAKLARIHDAGLFAGTMPNGSTREGKDQRLYDKLGAHPRVMDGVEGIAFVVHAPNARRVSVVGDFNFWDARRHPMRVRGLGYWELFIPHAKEGDHYKFDMIGPQGQHLPLKSDPLAFAAEMRPKTASIVLDETRLPKPRRADLDLRGPSRLMAAHEQQ